MGGLGRRRETWRFDHGVLWQTTTAAGAVWPTHRDDGTGVHILTDVHGNVIRQILA